MQLFTREPSRRRFKRTNDIQRLSGCQITELNTKTLSLAEHAIPEDLRIRDISEGGASIERSPGLSEITLGTEFRGSLELNSNFKMEFKFRIVRFDAQTVGIQFLNQTPEMRSLIRGYFNLF